MDLGSPTVSKVVGTLSLLAIAALGWTLVVGPETSALSETRAQVDSARQQNTVLLQQLGQLEEQKTELRTTRKVAEELAAQVPPTADQPGLFEQVTAAAVDAGIGPQGVTTLAPTPPVIGVATDGVTAEQPAVGSGTLATQEVSVSVIGTYDQTQQLLENLEHMARAYLITSVALSGSGEDGTGEDGAGEDGTGSFATTISGQMFVMPPVAGPSDRDVKTEQD